MMRVIIFFLLMMLIACSNKLTQLNPIGIKIDNIYINEMEEGDTIMHQLLIVYNCTLNSQYDSAINIKIKGYPSEEKAEGNFYLINSKDTLDLYLVTHESLKVPSKGEFQFGLSTNTINMVDLFDKRGYSVERHSKSNKITEVEFLKKIARESYIIFEWRDRKIEIRTLDKVKTIYRDPNDMTVD